MDNKEITKEQKRISKELKFLSKHLKEQGVSNFHNTARQEINKKYGKGWRERLEMMKVDEFISMSYFN